MASTHFTDTVTMVPADWANDVNALTYNVFGAASTVAQAVAALGLTWAVQNNLQATITGGSIDGTPIGANTPSTGAFTTLTATTQGTGATAVALVPFVTSAVATLQATLGTMAVQNKTAVSITGGAIDGTAIGLGTPAAAAFTAASVAATPINATDVANKHYVDSAITGLPNTGSMALQNANAVTITGGTIDNTVIGGTTPAEGFFLTLTARHLVGQSGTLWLDNALSGFFSYGAVMQASTNSPNAGVVLGASGAFTVNGSNGVAMLTLDPSGRLVLGGAVNDSLNTLQLLGGANIDKIILSTAITQPNQAVTKLYVDTSAANIVANVGGQISTAIGQLGSMAHQQSTAVAITGGNIDGVVIGATTPAQAAFTTVTTQTVGNSSGAVLFNQTSGNAAVVLNAPSPTKSNIAAWINTGGAFQVFSGTQLISQINSAGRSQFGIGAADDGSSVLLVQGQATVTGQMLLPQAPSVPNSATNKAYVDAQIATVQGSTVTPEYVNNQIAAAIAPLATVTYVNNSVAGLVNGAYVSSAIANALTGYATQSYVNTQISGALTTYATQTYVNTQITSALTNYATQAYVASALSGYASQSYVTSQLSSYVPTATLTASTGAAVIGYGATTVKAALDALSASSSVTQNANTVYAGPTAGVAATPTFRALVTADLPATISATTITTGALTATTSISTPTATFTGAGSITLPAGNTASRPGSPSAAMFRFNTDTTQLEFYTGTAWSTYLGSAGGTITGTLNVASLNVTNSATINTTGNPTLGSITGVGLSLATSGGTGDSHVQLDGYLNGGTATYVSYTGRALRGTAATAAALQNNDWLNGIDGYGFGATAFPLSATGAVAIVAEATFTDLSMPTAIVFQVTPSGSVTRAEAARFNNAGRLLVGTTTDNGTDIVQANGSISGKGVYPTATAAYDLGTGSRTWRNLYKSGVTLQTGYQVVTPATGATVTVTNENAVVFVDNATSIANLTIDLPTPLADGHQVAFSFLGGVGTAITWTPVSGTVHATVPTTATAGQVIRLMWRADTTTWRLA